MTGPFLSPLLLFAAACGAPRTTSGPPPISGTRADSRPLRAAAPEGAPANPPLYAADPCVVLKVSGDRVQLNKGADDGLRFGDWLAILQQEEPIAIVTLVEVEEQLSVGIVDLVLGRGKPRIGDLAEPYEKWRR